MYIPIRFLATFHEHIITINICYLLGLSKINWTVSALSSAFNVTMSSFPPHFKIFERLQCNESVYQAICFHPSSSFWGNCLKLVTIKSAEAGWKFHEKHPEMALDLEVMKQGMMDRTQT